MGTAFHDTGCRYQRKFCLIAEFRQGQRTAVAHGAANLGQRRADIVLQGAGIRNIGVNAFFEGEFLGAAQIIALPVAGTVGTFAPVFLVIGAVDFDLVRRAFVKAGEVAAEHQEICAHGQSQCHVVVVNDTAIGAYVDVDARFS